MFTKEFKLVEKNNSKNALFQTEAMMNPCQIFKEAILTSSSDKLHRGAGTHITLRISKTQTTHKKAQHAST